MIVDVVQPPTGKWEEQTNLWSVYAAIHDIHAVLNWNGYQAKSRFFAMRQFVQFLRDIDIPILFQPDAKSCSGGLHFGEGHRFGFKSHEDRDRFEHLADGLEPQFYQFKQKNYYEHDVESAWNHGIPKWYNQLVGEGALVSELDPYNFNAHLQLNSGTGEGKFIRFLRLDHATLFKLRWGQFTRVGD